MATSRPMRSVLRSRIRSSTPRTGSPSSWTTMSPVRARPARLGWQALSDIVAPDALLMPAASAKRRATVVVWADTPMKPRRTRPCRISSLTTKSAVLLATAKQMPCAPAITAVLIPITSPRWRRAAHRSCRDSGPHPSGSRRRSGGPSGSAANARARRRCPPSRSTRSRGGYRSRWRSARASAGLESPSLAKGRRSLSARSSARSASGSSPIARALVSRPSGRRPAEPPGRHGPRGCW